MSFINLREQHELPVLRCDVCLIGSGPAGLTIANELAASRLDLIIGESGDLTEHDEVESLNAIESVGEPRVIDQKQVRRRIFGGTAHAWSGRCATLELIDFEARDWVPASGWPIHNSDIEQYYVRAAVELGCGPHIYDHRAWEALGYERPGGPFDSNLIRDTFWQFSKSSTDPGDFERFAPRFRKKVPENVRVLINATATQLLVDRNGHKITGVEFKSLNGNTVIVNTDVVVLCTGGIENARLMLASNRTIPNGVGNDHDAVGRYLMDHPRQRIGLVDPKRPGRLRDRFGMYRNDKSGGQVYLSGVALSEKVQREEQLLNCAAFTTEVYKSTSPWGAIKRFRSGEASFGDYVSILSQPHVLVKGAYRRGVHGKSLMQPLSELALDCVVEQAPDPESRITLSSKIDRLGMPISRVKWKIGELERRSVYRFSQLIASELRRLDFGEVEWADWIQHQKLHEAEFIDHAHPIGSTRMSSDPRMGVVDANCKVHTVDGLYVAGSSVFPTAGHVNPTLTIVALAIRLADHIDQRLRPATWPSIAVTKVWKTPGKRVFVTGGGGKIGAFIVQSLIQKGFEVKAVTSRSRVSTMENLEWHRMDWKKDLDFDLYLEGCDAIIHAGAELNRMGLMQRINVEATEQLALAAERAHVKALCYASSVSVYGTPKVKVVTEESGVVDPYYCDREAYWAEAYMQAYARTKLLGEIKIKEAMRNMRCVIFRPTRVVDDQDIRDFLAVGRVRKVLQGYRYMHFVTIEDVAEAFVWGLERALSAKQPIFEIYNLSNDDLNAGRLVDFNRRAYQATRMAGYKPELAAPGAIDILRQRLTFRVSGKGYPLGLCRFSPQKLYVAGYRPPLGMHKKEILFYAREKEFYRNTPHSCAVESTH